jgi:hypothetical protein
MASVPSGAAAEIGSAASNSGGVVGLATGSQSDAIRTNIWAVEQIGDTIYVGGKFTAVTDGANQTSQPYLAAFDAASGAWVSDWRPVVNNSVNTLQASPDGTKLFIGGDFNSVNGASRTKFAVLDPVTGANASFGGSVSQASTVRAMDVQGDWLYLAGNISTVSSGGSSTNTAGAARFSVSTGAHDPNWAPVLAGGSGWGIAASSDTDRVYLSGFFTLVNGENRAGGFAAVSASTGQNIAGLEPFITNNTNRQYAQDVEVANGLVWVAGSEHYVYVMNESDLSLKAFHLSTIRGDFQDLEVVGDRVYAGCHCWANSVLYTRYDDVIPYPPSQADLAQAATSAPNTWISAFDASTGEHIPGFKPNIRSTGPGVWGIHGAPDGCLWVGGTIHRANDQPVNNLVRLCDEAGPDPDPDPDPDTTRPSPPGAVSVVGAGDGFVDLVWAESSDNLGVAGYRVFEASDNSVLLTSATSAGRLTAADGTYQVYVKAFDAAGNQSWRSGIKSVTVTSGGVVADTQRPNPPGMPKIVNTGPGFVDLSWNPATDNVGVVGYRLFDLNTGALLIDVAGTSARLELPQGSYRVYAKAYDAAGNQSWRSGARTVNI